MQKISGLMKVLAYAGVIPFAGLFLVIWFQPEQLIIDLTNSALWMMAYAAIILSFLGALHWGVLLSAPAEKLPPSRYSRMLLWGVTPAVLSWFAMLLPIPVALVALSSLTILAYIIDRLWLLPLAPTGFTKIRLHLTIAVSILLALSGIKLGVI